jgi:hypothetical protein
MTEAALAEAFASPPAQAWRPTPPAVRTATVEPDTYQPSAWLTRIVDGDDLRASARRTGIGLALTMPFAVAAALHSRSGSVDLLVAGLGIPVGLALIALVGVAASTLGVSLAAAPLAPTAAAAIASRGLFRTGLLLAGFAPLTALWVTGGRLIEGVLASTLVLATAGVSGIGTIARGVVDGTSAPNGAWRAGAVLVAVLFCGFALIVGLRLWGDTAAVLWPGGEP